MIKRVVLSAQAQTDLAALDRVIALRILGAIASLLPAPVTSKLCAAFIRPSSAFALEIGEFAFTTAAIGSMSSVSAIARTPIGEANSSLVFF